MWPSPGLESDGQRWHRLPDTVSSLGCISLLADTDVCSDGASFLPQAFRRLLPRHHLMLSHMSFRRNRGYTQALDPSLTRYAIRVCHYPIIIHNQLQHEKKVAHLAPRPVGVASSPGGTMSGSGRSSSHHPPGPYPPFGLVVRLAIFTRRGSGSIAT
jgi:hypothetical protein